MIIYNDFILKCVSWFFSVGGITLWPFIILRKKYKNNELIMINHERIHLKQQAEMLVVGFYVVYILNWLYLVIKHRDVYLAYRFLAFEVEAYDNEDNLEYLENRRPYAWLR